MFLNILPGKFSWNSDENIHAEMNYVRRSKNTGIRFFEQNPKVLFLKEF